MTDEQLAEWGRKENALRQAEMASVDSAEALARVQAACVARRKQVKLSAGQAAFYVKVGQRLERGESLSFALRR